MIYTMPKKYEGKKNIAHTVNARARVLSQEDSERTRLPGAQVNKIAAHASQSLTQSTEQHVFTGILCVMEYCAAPVNPANHEDTFKQSTSVHYLTQMVKGDRHTLYPVTTMAFFYGCVFDARNQST